MKQPLPSIFVRPAEGLRVPLDRARGHFAAEPTRVRATPYIRRRLAAGDLVLVERAAAPAARPSKES